MREAKARDFAARVDAAIDAIGELIEKGQGGKKPRASTTDPEARVMMADGGFRPGYNVQLATARSPLGGARTIVGVQVTNKESDYASVAPMLQQIRDRTGDLPKTLLADGGHSDHGTIEAAAALGVRALMPSRRDTKSPNHRGTETVTAWREQMTRPDAKALLRARASLCELPNAHAKTRFAMASVLVRGLEKVTSIALLVALTSNLLAHAASLLS